MSIAVQSADDKVDARTSGPLHQAAAPDPGRGKMDRNTLARSRLLFAAVCVGSALALAPPLLWAAEYAWLPAMLLVAVFGWRRHVRSAFLLAGASVLLVLLATPLAFEENALPLAAIWLLALAALRGRPRPEPPARGRFESILEHSELITLVIDADGRVSYANPAFLRLTGTTLAALGGREASSLFGEADGEALGEAMGALRSAGTPTVQLPRLRLATDADQPVFLQARLARIDRGPERGSLVLSATEVTGRVRAESALEGSRTRFASLFATSRDALLIVRADTGVVLDFNDAFSTLTGWSREEGLNGQVNDLVPLADPGDLQRIFAILERDGEFVDYECCVIRRSGRAVEVAISGRFAEIDGDRCVVSVLRDITESRRTEMALAESEEKFSRVFHRSPDAMSIVRLSDGVVIDVNDRFTKFFGRAHEDVVGRSMGELQPALAGMNLAELGEDMEDGGHLDLDFEYGGRSVPARATFGGDPRVFELEFEVDGRLLPTLVSTTVAEINGSPCAISLIKDMSELQAARLALEESEQRFRGAFEHAPIGMMLVRPEDGRIGQVNHMLCELLGYRAEELVGRAPEDLMPCEDREAGRVDEGAVLSETGDHEGLETRYLRSDGSVVWTNRHVVIERAPDGTPLRTIVQLTDITALKESREQMEKLAFYDTLTGLANRRLFTNRLEHAVRHSLRSGRPTALMYLDLDNFKRVNDSLGHEAGDELLRAVAERLQSCVRKEDTVGRMGGDEFTLLLAEVRNGRAAATVAKKVLAALAEPVMVANHEFRVTTSIGVTLATDDGTDTQTLLRNADLAMYRAKERGRDNYQFFSEDMNSRAMDRLILENELRTALSGEEFELYYQPQIAVTSGDIVGMEALVRWRHPRRGVLAPDEFIQVAEESGLILPLGEWSIRKACTQIAAMREQTGTAVRIAVNLSARQFADPGLPEAVQRALEEAELDPGSLELEITETMLMHDIDEAIGTLETLHGLGVSLAVDDFGTGYSSLNYLKRLPLDRVKVDRVFVSDIPNDEDDMAITSAVIAMAHQLKLEVTAEGVETQAQLDFLAAAQCELVQGYLFGAPVPFEEALDMIGDRPVRPFLAGA